MDPIRVSLMSSNKAFLWGGVLCVGNFVRLPSDHLQGQGNRWYLFRLVDWDFHGMGRPTEGWMNHRFVMIYNDQFLNRVGIHPKKIQKGSEFSKGIRTPKWPFRLRIYIKLPRIIRFPDGVVMIWGTWLI